MVARQHKHGHRPPGVIFGSYSCEMKPRSQLSLLFPPLYLYYCNAHREKKSSKISIATVYWPHLLPFTPITLDDTSVSVVVPPLVIPLSFSSFDIQLAHFSSAWSSVLWATPILEVVGESQPVWFGMLIATRSLQLCWIGGCWTQGSSAISSGLNRRLHSGCSLKPKLKWKWQAFWGWTCQVSFI